MNKVAQQRRLSRHKSMQTKNLHYAHTSARSKREYQRNILLNIRGVGVL